MNNTQSLDIYPLACAVSPIDLSQPFQCNQLWSAEFAGNSLLDGLHNKPTVLARLTRFLDGESRAYEEVIADGKRRLWHFGRDETTFSITFTDVPLDPSTIVLNETRILAETLATFNSRLVNAHDESAILGVMFDLVAKFEPSRSSLLYKVKTSDSDDTKLGTLEVVAQTDNQGRSILTGESIPIFRFDAETYPITRLVQEQPESVIFVEDYLTDSNFPPDGPAAAFMAQVGDRATILMPLLVIGQWQGIFTWSFAKPIVFDALTRRIVVEIRSVVAGIVASRRLYAENVAALEEMKRIDQIKDEFLANVSHELRTPLNAIIGLSDLIVTGISNDTTEDVRRIAAAGQQLNNLVNDILDMSKIETGMFSLSCEMTDPVYIAEQVAEIIGVPVIDKDLNWCLDMATDLPMLYCDPGRIGQVLLNLIYNAVKFSEHGTITLSVQNTEDRKGVTWSVSDQGRGILPEHQDLIFQRFRQVDGSLSRRVNGTGLGLPISRKLVELHGGKLELTSSPGKGSMFYFTIPVTAPNSITSSPEAS